MSYNGEVITSSQNKYVSLARSLEDKKGRLKSSLYRFDGIKLMCEAVRKGVELDFLIVSDRMYDSVFSKARELYGVDSDSLGCKIFTVAHTVFERLSDENAPEGVICVARFDNSRHGIASAEMIEGIGPKENILLLESVRDPQNVGAIMRAAAAFNVSLVIMSNDCADIYSAKTVRASMGTLFSLRTLRVSSVADAALALKRTGRRVFAAALDREAERLGETEIRRGDCVIIGNEGHGISPEALDASTGCVFIPMADGVESLNAATAAAVLLWEFFGGASS